MQTSSTLRTPALAMRFTAFPPPPPTPTTFMVCGVSSSRLSTSKGILFPPWLSETYALSSLCKAVSIFSYYTTSYNLSLFRENFKEIIQKRAHKIKIIPFPVYSAAMSYKMCSFSQFREGKTAISFTFHPPLRRRLQHPRYRRYLRYLRHLQYPRYLRYPRRPRYPRYRRYHRLYLHRKNPRRL